MAGAGGCSRMSPAGAGVEGCSSHTGSKTMAWREMSPGSASGLAWHPGAMNGWEKQTGGEVSAVS